MGLETLQELYVDELKDLYNAEKQLTKALPKLAAAASSPDLKAGFEEHLKQTEGQIARLEQIFEQLGRGPGGKHCKAMEGLITEGDELIKEGGDPEVLDAALICAAQKVEHYEMASYGTVRTWAKLLGEQEASALLQQTLDEEGQTDKKLTQLAERQINRQAKAA
jgi:ferritin-like metal-binding protein YciE